MDFLKNHVLKKKNKGGNDAASATNPLNPQTSEENHLTDLVLGRINEDLPDGFATSLLSSSSELLKLRQVAQDRIIDEMIAEVKKSCTLSPDYIILVLD